MSSGSRGLDRVTDGDAWVRRFDDFVSAQHDFVSTLDDGSGSKSARHMVAEARNAARLFGPFTFPGARVLEVGAGLGVFSAFLSDYVGEVVALEPGGTGFSERSGLRADHPALNGVRWSNETAESFRDEPFDLILSMNVIEHVSDLPGVFANLASLLRPSGQMVHSCPNYSFPYEPHFGVPLLPWRPAMTARLLPERISGSDLWHSLNFVTAQQLEDLGLANDLETSFVPGLVSGTVSRLTTDEAFRERHPVLGKVARLVGHRAVLQAVDRLPATWMTPVVCVMTPGDRKSP